MAHHFSFWGAIYITASSAKGPSHDAIFLATCNAFLPLVGRCKIGEYKFPSQFANISFNIPNICHKFTSLKSRIALQVARKIAPCDRALTRTSVVCIGNAAKNHTTNPFNFLVHTLSHAWRCFNINPPPILVLKYIFVKALD